MFDVNIELKEILSDYKTIDDFRLAAKTTTVNKVRCTI